MKNRTYVFQNKRIGKLFLYPTLIILLALTLFPFVFSIALTFGKVNLTDKFSIQYAGIDNWKRLFLDERFWNALKNTIFIVVLAIPLQYLIGLLLVLSLNLDIKGKPFFRVVFLIPMMLTPIAVGYMWRMLFDLARGPVNNLLSLIKIEPIGWLTTTNIVKLSIIVTDVWHWTPLVFLVLFAGIQSIPQEMTEAAQVDGASGWQLFRFVLFPLLLPVSLAVVLLRTIELFKVIDEIYIMSAGGPGLSSESITLFGYNVGLRSFDLSYGSTIAFSLFITILIVAYVFFSATKSFQEITFE